jgi:hypothetical protein
MSIAVKLSDVTAFNHTFIIVRKFDAHLKKNVNILLSERALVKDRKIRKKRLREQS